MRTFVSCIIVITMGILFVARPAMTGNPVYLEGLYATSTALDYEKYGPHHLFDGGGYWATMNGAAADEGVMLYFENRQKISRIKIDLPDDPGIAKISSVILYTDGTAKGEFSAADTIPVNETCSSIFIRIGTVDGLSVREVPSGKAGVTKKTKRFESDKRTGIAKLTLFGSDGAPLDVIPPKIVKGSIKPSSTLAPEEAYNAGYLFDGRRDSGWVEGNKGSGTGESLNFHFGSDVTISKIRIWNGLLISDVHYSANERVKDFSFFTGSESGAKKYALPDSKKAQTVAMDSPLKGKDFTLRINGIYKGTRYTDTVISELLFNDGNRWFTLYSGEIEKRKKDLLSKIKGSVIEKIVDRSFGETLSADNSSESTSIVLRSDSSFVIYLEKFDVTDNGNMTRAKILDGFWNINSLDGEKAVITIMGRNFSTSDQFVQYEGEKSSKAVSIFSDRLTVTKKSIKGEKFFGSINL
ncbi:MAG TPA: hypothetical protein PKK43_07445 [Spirochaetota bacterium]|nr:hypothetical protein [Spirochaetota bacterium]